MAANILAEADFDAVRYLLGVDSDTLPDAVIRALPNLEFVEAIVMEMADDWDDTTQFAGIKTAAGSDWTYLRTGTMHLLAARLVAYARVNEVDSVRIGTYSESGRSLSWSERTQECIQHAAEALSYISTRTFNQPKFFEVTGPTSSEAAVPEYWEEWQEMILPRILDWQEEGEEDDVYYSTSR